MKKSNPLFFSSLPHTGDMHDGAIVVAHDIGGNGFLFEGEV